MELCHDDIQAYEFTSSIKFLGFCVLFQRSVLYEFLQFSNLNNKSLFGFEI